jgi:hypothetical protein
MQQIRQRVAFFGGGLTLLSIVNGDALQYRNRFNWGRYIILIQRSLITQK